MKGFRVSFRYGALSVKNELRGINLYVIAIVVFVIIQYCFSGVSGYLADNMDQMNLFELYAYFLSSQGAQTIYLIGVMAFSCGILFYTHGAAYYLIRANRRRWALGQGFYLLFMVAVYNLFLLFSLCCSTGGHLTLRNEWSFASMVASQFMPHSIGVEDIIYVSSKWQQVSPLFAGIVTFLLSVLVGMLTGIIMICCSLRNKSAFGVAIILILWFADYLIDGIAAFSKAKYLSPFGISRTSRLLEWGGGSAVIYGVVFLSILVVIGMYVLLESVEKIDFLKLE